MIALFVVLLAPILIAAGWNKAYFAATKPGSWATIRVTSTITPPFTTTSTRMPDVDGRVVIEQRTESGDSASPPSTMRYELANGFNADRDLIDHLKAVVAASAKTGADDAYTELPADTVAALKTMATYAATATFKGTGNDRGKAVRPLQLHPRQERGRAVRKGRHLAQPHRPIRRGQAHDDIH